MQHAAVLVCLSTVQLVLSEDFVICRDRSCALNRIA
jgi:hypothetical protein